MNGAMPGHIIMKGIGGCGWLAAESRREKGVVMSIACRGGGACCAGSLIWEKGVATPLLSQKRGE